MRLRINAFLRSFAGHYFMLETASAARGFGRWRPADPVRRSSTNRLAAGHRALHDPIEADQTFLSLT